MRPRITLNTFRKIGRMHETMIRSTMPRTSEACPEPLRAFAAPTEFEVLARQAGSRLVRPLAFTMREAVANA